MENWFDPSIPGSARVIDPYRGIPEGLSGVADALSARKKRKLDEELARAKMGLETRRADLYGKQIDAQNKSIDRQDRVANQKFQIEEAKRRGEVGRDIGRAFGQGRPGQAAVIAHSSQFVGPDDQLQGVDLQPVPNPVERKPQPAVPQAPEWQGPLEPPDEARARAMFEGLGRMGQGQQGTEPPPFDPNAPTPEDQGAAAMKAGDEAANFSTQQQGARDKFAMQQRDYPGQKIEADKSETAFADAEKNPKYKISYPGGTSDVIDPREEKKAITAEAVDRADKLEQAAAAIASTRPDVAESMIQQSRLIRSGISNADKAPITNMGAAVQSQGAKAVESEKDREVKRMAIRAKAMHKGLTGGGPAPGSVAWYKEENNIRSELNDYETQHQLGKKGGLAEKQQLLSDAYQSASEAKQNPGMQILIMDRLLKSASGLGVRQQTLQTYKDHLTGLMGRGEGVASEWLGTGMGQEQWHNVTEAIREELSQAQAQGGKENADFHSMADKSPLFKRHPDAVSRREGGMFGGLHGYGGKQAPQAAPAPKPAPANLAPEDQAAIKMAQDRLAKNPNDSVAQQVLKLHGM